MTNCPFCGKSNTRPATIDIAKCPRCKEKLTESTHQGSGIDFCNLCQGVWIDTDDFNYLTTERSAYSDNNLARSFERRTKLDQSPYLNCVRCDKIMTRSQYKRISGVLIDTCGNHGAWLDAGELETIRTFIANGGLDKSQDKDILKNKIDITKVAEDTRELKFLVKKINKWNFKRIFWDGF
jgi:Zn-finger nucleic acid-binding protein